MRGKTEAAPANNAVQGTINHCSELVIMRVAVVSRYRDYGEHEV
jgi:hypothetical protein